MSKEVLIKFETEEQAAEFMSWLSNSGEQEYFAMKEYVDEKDSIVDVFDYDYENNIIDGYLVDE